MNHDVSSYRTAPRFLYVADSGCDTAQGNGSAIRDDVEGYIRSNGIGDRTKQDALRDLSKLLAWQLRTERT